MGNLKFTSFLTLIAFLSFTTLAYPAKADETTPGYESVPELFLRASTHKSGDFFRSVSLKGQLNLILGFNQFPENQITRDAKLINILSQDFQRHMVGEDRLRTRDIANPFQSSLNENPSYLGPLTP
ncbi:hypothetical protein [Gloeocapsa sp. PCC 73106]|uniref:hypothetical protein n=1 Tax=Gloeocapsa sp. PCC 73106 TaxID=102232 RepID=UPI0002AC0D9C|nr:hypothetical protein [Gloeocapsa sp. PCC 73106]ELR98011.1 hypothetical protein GLO73106DRAFT_00018310 [Gloeocapsa sp. PCC 73106]